VNLILFCIREYYRLAEGVSDDEANLIFNNVAPKVIKDAFKHACRISVASYYTQVNLLLFCTLVLKLLFFFTLTCKYNSLLHVGVEKGNEAHPGPRGLSDQGAALSGGDVDWLVKDSKAWVWLCGWWASNQFRAMLERNRQNRMSRESVHCYVRKMQRMVIKTHNFNSQLLRN
jgi:hypothetical protein